MTTVVLDTNVLVQALISSSRAASARVLDALYDGRFRLAFSPETVDELVDVLLVSRIRERHGLSDDELIEFVNSVLVDALYHINPNRSIPGDLARDVTDTKFLAVAQAARADYLVTNDHRHLLRLRQFGSTQIVTPALFLACLR
jgi:putative PIN family toxin of toxin-antitoxin system